MRPQRSETVHDRMTDDLPINSVVSIAIVPDPYSTIGEKIKVVRSLRDDTLGQMHSYQRIDDAQLAAGRLWQLYFERSEIGSIRAIDPGKEAVDGGRIPEMITDEQIKAFRELNNCHARLGSLGASLVRDILGSRLTIKQAAELRGMMTARGTNYTSRRFIECLETMASFWGLAG